MRAVIEGALLAQRGALIGWVPVCLAVGIGIYFSLPVEPELPGLAVVALAGLAAFVAARLTPVAYAPICIALVLIGTGIGLAKWRTDWVEAPVLTFRYYGPIEGRVVNIDRSASDATRLTLDRVVLARMSPERTPARVRVSVHGAQVINEFNPGERLIMTGHLSPPAGPAEPAGFDFQRHAWFLQLGAVGYTRTPVLRLEVAQVGSWRMRIFAWRMRLSNAVQKAMPGETGAFAAAIMTGDRSAMGQAVLEDLRAANLAHLLAISGLHMGLLTGFIFAVVRYGLALIPLIALRYPTKKIAAVAALIVGAFYLALSGGNVATERAFVMVAVMLVAVLLDRRALTLRAVAIAAVIILIWQPEALTGPGFQMSFAATTALVFVFGLLRKVDLTRLPKWTRGPLSVVLSSFVAGLATAPFAAAHFNQIAHYGLIANVLSVPLMGVLVMPAAVLAMCLAPFGLWSLGLWFMDLGLRWIIFVAQTVAGLQGALSHVPAPDPRVLPLMALGLLAFILWRGHGRFLGLLLPLFAGGLWLQTARPQVLVADNGSLLGMMTAEGRVLSKSSGSGFVAGIWLENDGAPVDQRVAADRAGLVRQGRVVTADLFEWRIMQVSGKTALADLDGCGGADVLISDQVVETARPCEVFDQVRLRETGSLALDVAENGDLRVTSARAVAGARPWNSRDGIQAEVMVLENERAAAATLLTDNLADQ